MKIVLEGIDGAGKTTLARILADKYNLDICHCTQYDPTDYHFYLHTVRKNNIVWDRHTIGELIYPIIFERESKLSIEDVRLILYYGKENGANFYILNEDVELIKERLIKRGGEDPRILNNLKWIQDKFLFYAEIFHVPVISTSNMTLDEMYNLVF